MPSLSTLLLWASERSRRRGPCRLSRKGQEGCVHYSYDPCCSLDLSDPTQRPALSVWSDAEPSSLGPPTVSTFTECSCMAGSVPEEHKSCPAALCQGKPRPGLWLGSDLTCHVTLGLYCFPGPLPSVYKMKVF